MRVADFADLVSSMPTREHAFWAWRRTWEPRISAGGTAGRALEAVFALGEDASGAKVSRGDIRRFGEQRLLPECIMAALVWGYPGGMRGYTKSVCDNLASIVEMVEPWVGHNIRDWAAHFEGARPIRGLGLSTYSKSIAFLPVQVGGHQALILDDVVATVVGDGRFEEFDHLTGLSYQNAPAKYPDYLASMNRVARQIGADAEQLEMFLFAFGRNLKTPV
jgi:hypothetical protein